MCNVSNASIARQLERHPQNQDFRQSCFQGLIFKLIKVNWIVLFGTSEITFKCTIFLPVKKLETVIRIRYPLVTEILHSQRTLFG